MAMLRGPSTAALGIPADPSVEGVGVVAVAQLGGCRDDERHWIALADHDVFH
jgi:hypothetical protein